jgi:hypothetical protein
MIKNNQLYAYLSIACFCLGILFIVTQREWIIFNFSSERIFIKNDKQTFYKKNTQLFFYKNSQWKSERNDILWSSDQATNITNLIQNWLILLEEENITLNKITLQSTLITQNSQTAYLSFDQSLFSEDQNTYQKLMIVESLLKTLKENSITIPNVQILAHHKLIKDQHLDFSQAWPLAGFTN